MWLSERIRSDIQDLFEKGDELANTRKSFIDAFFEYFEDKKIKTKSTKTNFQNCQIEIVNLFYNLVADPKKFFVTLWTCHISVMKIFEGVFRTLKLVKKYSNWFKLGFNDNAYNVFMALTKWICTIICLNWLVYYIKVPD